MKAFIWKNLPVVSDRYHSDGGALIIAETLEQAKQGLKIIRDVSYQTIPGTKYYAEKGDPFKHWCEIDQFKDKFIVKSLKIEPSPFPEKNPGWVRETFEITVPIDENPDFIFEALGVAPQVVTFPNAGCC